MTVAGESILFKIEVDGARAKRELDTIGKSAETMGGGLDKLNRGLGKFDSATRETQKVLRGLGDTMGGTKNKGIEFLGVAGDLAGAFASGGAFTAGVMGAAFVIAKVADAYNEAKVNGRAFQDGMPSLTAAVLRLKEAALEPGRQSVADFAKQLRDFGKDARQIAIDSQQFLVSNTEAGGGRLTAAEARQSGIVTELARAKVGGKKIDEDDYRLQIELLKRIRERQAANNDLQSAVSAALAEMKAQDAQLDKRESARNAKGGAARAGAGPGAIVGDPYMDFVRQQALDNEAAMYGANDVIEQAQAVADAKDEIEDASIQRRIAANILYNETISALGQQALGEAQAAASMGLGVFQGYLAAKIAGEEHAEEKATAAFMQGIGNQLVGIGTRSLFEGGAKLFNPVTAPIGIAEMVFGGSAIAAGLGLGAAGASVSAGIPGEPKADSKASTDRGVNGRRGAGGGATEGGGIVVNISYSAAGPMPEQTGREVQDALNALRRRQGLTPVRQGPGA